MLFSSVTFLFCFLPFVIIGYYLLPPVLRNGFLLVSSLFFYAWGEPYYLGIMLSVILLNYVSGLLLDRFREWNRQILFGAIVSNLLILGIFKYTDFVIQTINSVANSNIEPYNIVLPIGISFYIFQSMSYVIDLYRGIITPQHSLYKFALYVSLFPQLIAGPIVKYKDISSQIDNRKESLNDVVEGIRRFIIGLGKKVLLANTMGAVADEIFAAGPTSLDVSVAWLGALAYSLQIFFDFSGYSDMAIGLGRVFGFKFLENFNYPYISSSITEFWRRWHISLSSWFKDYLYIPLGGNRVSIMRNNINLLIVFFATGLWHGASWNFVVWGMWHGLFLMLEKRLHLNKMTPVHLYKKAMMHIYVILVFVFGWVFFRADNLDIAASYIMTMLGFINTDAAGYSLSYYMNRKFILMLGISILFCYPWKFEFFDKVRGAFVIRDIVLIFILIASISSIAASSYNPFIYFRF